MEREVSELKQPLNMKKNTPRSAGLATVIFTSLAMGLIGGGIGYLGARSVNVTTTTTGTRKTITETLQNVTITNEDSAITEVSAKTIDSVVSIVATQQVSSPRGRSLFEELFGSGESTDSDSFTRRKVSAGTGFIASENGYIITNRHVVDANNAQYTVIFNSGEEIEGKIVDRDTVLDIAFLKIDPSKLKKTQLQPVTLGSSSDIKIGQTAIAIGNSLGEFSNTVSKGIISGLNRSIEASDESGFNVETLDNIIQTDASINSGNSGGPLLDIKGNVIGVNVAKASGGENIGFAIPIDLVKPILDSVNRTGKIVRPYIGVRYIDITPALATARGLSVENGALLEGSGKNSAVVPNSPASRAGLQAGDIITAINGEKIAPQKSLRNLLPKYSVGETIEVTFIRNGNEQTVSLVLDQLR